ncbi:hypothetical protein VTO42DRAFT_7991 [Malbranchea cinnamomea]
MSVSWRHDMVNRGSVVVELPFTASPSHGIHGRTKKENYTYIQNSILCKCQYLVGQNSRTFCKPQLQTGAAKGNKNLGAGAKDSIRKVEAKEKKYIPEKRSQSCTRTS